MDIRGKAVPDSYIFGAIMGGASLLVHPGGVHVVAELGRTEPSLVGLGQTRAA